MTPDTDSLPYRSAAAFRAALRNRLAALARSGGHGLDGLQRQVAYDRLLVDLVLIAGTQQIDADALSLAVGVGSAHRGLLLPPRFTVPDLDLWRRGYPARAKEAATAVPDFDTAVRRVAALLGPILDGTATGTWNPETGSWTQPADSLHPMPTDTP